MRFPSLVASMRSGLSPPHWTKPSLTTPTSAVLMRGIEFKREGHATVAITISRELVEQARALELTTAEVFAEAIRLAVPGVFDLAGPHPPRWH
jgi:hypothetical protein